MSGTAPFAKLAITIPAGVVAVGSGDPWAWFKRAVQIAASQQDRDSIVALVHDARSGTPSAFKSPVVIATGVVPTEKGEFWGLRKSDVASLVDELNKIETLFEFLFTTARSTSGALPFVLVVKFLIRKFALTIATGFDSLIVPVFGSLKASPEIP